MNEQLLRAFIREKLVLEIDAGGQKESAELAIGSVVVDVPQIANEYGAIPKLVQGDELTEDDQDAIKALSDQAAADFQSKGTVGDFFEDMAQEMYAGLGLNKQGDFVFADMEGGGAYYSVKGSKNPGNPGAQSSPIKVATWVTMVIEQFGGSPVNCGIITTLGATGGGGATEITTADGSTKTITCYAMGRTEPQACSGAKADWVPLTANSSDISPAPTTNAVKIINKALVGHSLAACTKDNVTVVFAVPVAKAGGGKKEGSWKALYPKASIGGRSLSAGYIKIICEQMALSSGNDLFKGGIGAQPGALGESPKSAVWSFTGGAVNGWGAAGDIQRLYLEIGKPKSRIRSEKVVPGTDEDPDARQADEADRQAAADEEMKALRQSTKERGRAKRRFSRQAEKVFELISAPPSEHSDDPMGDVMDKVATEIEKLENYARDFAAVSGISTNEATEMVDNILIEACAFQNVTARLLAEDLTGVDTTMENTMNKKILVTRRELETIISESLLLEDLTGADKSEIKRMIKKEIEGTINKKIIDKAFKKNFDKELKKALGVSFFGTPGKINKFVVDEIHDEVDKILGDAATKEMVVQICKDVIIKLYRELSFTYKPVIQRLKI